LKDKLKTIDRTKKEHYVPQFYLRRFCSSDGGIFVYDKPLNKVFRANVRDIASDKYFYDMPAIDGVVGMEQFVEKYFHPIESETAAVLEKLVLELDSGTFDHLSGEHRSTLSIFLVFQFMRTVEARHEIVQTIEKLEERLLRDFLATKHPEVADKDFKVVLNEEEHASLHAEHLLNYEFVTEMAETISKHLWFIDVNETPLKLFCSDNPLVKQPHIRHPWRTMSGLASKGIEIVFPISSKYAIDIAEGTVFASMASKDGQAIIIRESENIVFFNSLQVRDSTRQVFCETGEFDLAKEMCRNHPELREPDRARVIIQ
jgi:hypothetical protein